jgi:hypothetical protein
MLGLKKTLMTQKNGGQDFYGNSTPHQDAKSRFS